MRGGAEEREQPGRGRRAAATALVALLALAVQAPFFARGLSLLDEGSVLAVADALARGEVLYRDRIVVVAPLTYESLALAFRWLGTDVAVARAFQAALFVACVLLVLGVLRRVSCERWALAGALSLLALKPLAFPLWTIVNYSQLGLAALLLVLGSLLRWLERRSAAGLALVGFAGGLAFLAKQNLGALAGAAVGAVLLADWWSARPRRARSLAARAGIVIGASLAPVAAMALRYARQGALPAAWTHGVAGLASLTDGWALPFPPLAPWSRDDPEWGLRVFAFFPASVVELGLAGGLDLAAAPLSHLVEWAVKLCYLAPLVAVALLGRRWLRAPPPRPAGALACALFAGGAWASMLYRPDWAHLVNVWPLLHVALVAAVALGGARTRLALGGVAAAAFLFAAAVASWAFFRLDWQELRTARGTLAAPAYAARAVEPVLRWEAGEPAERRIAFLPVTPLFHFVTGRPLPLAGDMLIPGVFDAADDERLARELEAVERVVYASRTLPFVRGDTVDVSPAVARALATRFRFTKRIAPGYFVFERAPRPAAEAETRTLFGLAPGAAEERWLFHRVWALGLGAGERRCVEVPWRVSAGERVVATTMSHPSEWHARPSAEAALIDFELAVATPASGPPRARVARRAASAGPERWELPLGDLPAGAEVVLRFCAALARPARDGASVAAGFAEPRVERLPAATAPPAAARMP